MSPITEPASQRTALKLRATRPQGALMSNDSSCPLGHNTPIPLERSPPASFKRLLGRGFTALSHQCCVRQQSTSRRAPCSSPVADASEVHHRLERERRAEEP